MDQKSNAACLSDLVQAALSSSSDLELSTNLEDGAKATPSPVPVKGKPSAAWKAYRDNFNRPELWHANHVDLFWRDMCQINFGRWPPATDVHILAHIKRTLPQFNGAAWKTIILHVFRTLPDLQRRIPAFGDLSLNVLWGYRNMLLKEAAHPKRVSPIVQAQWGRATTCNTTHWGTGSEVVSPFLE